MMTMKVHNTLEGCKPKEILSVTVLRAGPIGLWVHSAHDPKAEFAVNMRLDATEARDLAAMLLHYAQESER